MKDTGNAAEKLLDLPYAPEAEAYLDELERSGQFRVGVEAELDDQDVGAPISHDYTLARGVGRVPAQDWWTSGAVAIRVAAGIPANELALSRVNDSLVVHTRDGLDRVTLDNYLGLIPDASTLRVIFADGSEWTGPELLSKVTSWLEEAPSSAPNH